MARAILIMLWRSLLLIRRVEQTACPKNKRPAELAGLFNGIGGGSADPGADRAAIHVYEIRAVVFANTAGATGQACAGNLFDGP